MSNRLYRNSLLWLMLLISVYGFAQTGPPLIWGESNEHLKGYEVNDMFGFDENTFYVFRENRRKKHPYALQRISVDSLKTIGEHIFNVASINGLEPRITTTLTLSNKAYFIATTAQTKSDSLFLYAYEIRNDPMVGSKPVLLTTASIKAVDSEKQLTVFKDTEKDLFMLIVPRETDPTKNEKYELLVFNSLLEKINSKEIEIPYPAHILEYHDALIDKSGNAYVLASRKNTSLSALNKDRNIGRDFSLFIYNWEGETLLEKSLSLGSKWLYDVRLLINKNGNIQVAGYYSNMIDLIMAGTFSLELDKVTGEVLNQGLNPFGREFRTQFRPKSGNISDTELGMFNLDYILPKPNGITQLISEKNFTETSTIINPGTGMYSIITIYNYDEILISAIDASSKIKYNLIIPKYQSSTSAYDTYTSFIAFSDSGKTFLVYNDNDRNKSLPLDDTKGYRQLTTASSSAAILVVIHENGETVKLPLYSASREFPVFNPNHFYQTDDGVILLAGSGYDIRFLKVKLK